jgi:hypothetical protein
LIGLIDLLTPIDSHETLKVAPGWRRDAMKSTLLKHAVSLALAMAVFAASMVIPAPLKAAAATVLPDSAAVRAPSAVEVPSEPLEKPTVMSVGDPLAIQYTGLSSLVPGRLLDTRGGAQTIDGRFAGSGRVSAGGVVEVAVAGRAGVSASAAAAMLNITVVGAADAGFVTAFPCGGQRPETSNVNYVAGATVANAALLKLSDTGSICLYSYAAADLIVDVSSYSFSYPAGTTVTQSRISRGAQTRLTHTDGVTLVVPEGALRDDSTFGRVAVLPTDRSMPMSTDSGRASSS